MTTAITPLCRAHRADMWLPLGHIWTCSEAAWIPGRVPLKDRNPPPHPCFPLPLPQPGLGQWLETSLGPRATMATGLGVISGPMSHLSAGPQSNRAKPLPQLLLTEGPSIAGDSPTASPTTAARGLQGPTSPKMLNWIPDPAPIRPPTNSPAHGCDHG